MKIAKESEDVLIQDTFVPTPDMMTQNVKNFVIGARNILKAPRPGGMMIDEKTLRDLMDIIGFHVETQVK
jgi:hypothetical protein